MAGEEERMVLFWDSLYAEVLVVCWLRVKASVSVVLVALTAPMKKKQIPMTKINEKIFRLL